MTPTPPSSPAPPQRPTVAAAFAKSPIAMLLATGLGAGLSPVAPGTAGSAAAAIAAFFALRWLNPSHGPSIAAAVGLLASGLLAVAVGIPIATRASRAMGAKDPGAIVIDEIAGQWIALAPVPFFAFSSPLRESAAWGCAFFAFRLFDVWKPGPVDRLQALPEGVGIVLDDALAGAFAAGVTVIFCGAVATWR